MEEQVLMCQQNYCNEANIGRMIVNDEKNIAFPNLSALKFHNKKYNI